jgi:hypothetical protein
VRKVIVVAAIATGLTGCGGSTASHARIRFGVTGGNLRGYHVTIQPDGSVQSKGSLPASRRQIAPTRVRQLEREIQQAHLASRQCAGVLPDIASRYIRVAGRTVMVHGSCDQDFQRIWTDLVQAAGLSRS